MSGIRVVTDDASDLSPALIGSLPVSVVPLEVRLGNLGPEQTGKMTPAEFWQACATTDVLPQTSAPSPGQFQQAFLAARDQGHEAVVCITLSSDLSATYQAAVAAASAVAGEISVEVVDSRTVTMAEGLIALEAAGLAAGGATLEEVVAAVRQAIGRVVAIGALDTLDNLRRGGRIGTAQAFFGSLLSLKPVLEIRDGVVEGESRQRTRGRSLRYVADKVAALGPYSRLAVVHAAAPDVEEMVDLVAKYYPRDEILVSYIGPVVGAHAGPGTMVVCALRT
ncbi:MAG: hypothetical protein JWM85_2343 [Acidimicrobiaceae bacterium]|nr:hypothetical protein [Acidimicrobiaceae bacterium]